MTPKGLPKRFRLPVTAFTLILLSGCATAPQTVVPVRDVAQEERLMLLQQKVRDKESEIDRLAAAVEILKAKSEMKEKINSDSSESVERRLPRVKLSPKNIPEKEENDSAFGTEESVSLADSRHESMHWYFRGLTLIEKKQPEQAIEAFQAFLKASPHHVYSDRAQFWIGEAYFRAKEYPLAVIALNRLEHEFPDSFRYVEAAWKKSLSLEQIGRTEEAMAHLKELIRKFPRHPLSDEAGHRLAALEVEAAKAKP